MDVKRVLGVRRYKAGYVVKHELIDGAEWGSEDFEMVNAYTPTGNYIGDAKLAYRLCKIRGIAPEVLGQEGAVDAKEANGGMGYTCSIGFCASEQKWYGWSHRALYGFGIGSTVKKGDCAYVPATFDAMLEDIRASHEFDEQGENLTTRNVKFVAAPDCVIVQCEQWRPQEVHISDAVEAIDRIDESGDVPSDLLTGPKQWVEITETYLLGKGEWTAHSLDDAKRMASDFARGVS